MKAELKINDLVGSAKMQRSEDGSCKLCGNDGFTRIVNGHNQYAKPCPCRIPKQNKHTLQAIMNKIPYNVRKNLDTEGFLSGQEEIYNTFERKMWIGGETRKGKTHMIARKIIDTMGKANRTIKAEWYEAKELELIFMQQHGDNSERRDYMRTLDRISKLDIIVLNDIDKLSKDQKGKISFHKSTQLWSLFDDCIASIPIVMISANCTIDKFCGMLSENSDTLRSRLVSDIVPCELVEGVKNEENKC